MPASADVDAAGVERIGEAQVDVAVPIGGTTATQLLWVVRVEPGNTVKAHEVLAGVRCPNDDAQAAESNCISHPAASN